MQYSQDYKSAGLPIVYQYRDTADCRGIVQDVHQFGELSPETPANRQLKTHFEEVRSLTLSEYR